MDSVLSVPVVQALFILLPVLFAIALWWLVRTATQPVYKASRSRAALFTLAWSVITGSISGAYMWWLSIAGPSNAQLSYRGNGALDAFSIPVLSLIVAVSITAFARIWLALIVAIIALPVSFVLTYALLAR